MLNKFLIRSTQRYATKTLVQNPIRLASGGSGNLRAAVLLAGSGVYDGTEITEATSLLIALSRANATVTCFAPNRNQAHVVNHLTGEESDETRNVLEESARIARGAVSDLETLDHTNFDALFIPGGFGAAKNLSDFGFKGTNMVIHPDVGNAILDFHHNSKYVAMCCISPILAARVFGTMANPHGRKGATITLGKRGDDWPYGESIDAAIYMGNELVEVDINEVVVDEERRLVTAPAYMKGTAKPHQVYDNI